MKKYFALAVLCALVIAGCGNNPMSPNSAAQAPVSNQLTAQESIPGERFIASSLFVKVYAYYNTDEKTDYLILKNASNQIIRYEKMPGPGIAHHGLTSIRIQSAKFAAMGRLVAIKVERITFVTNHAVMVYNHQGEFKFMFDRTTENLDHGRLLQINNYTLTSTGLFPRRGTLNVEYQKYNYYYDPVKHQEHWILDETVNTLTQVIEI